MNPDKPNGNMTEAELIALHANPDRHPNALSYELARCKIAVLVNLAYQEHGFGSGAAPDELAAAAYDEMERRDRAVGSLLRDNPSIIAEITPRGAEARRVWILEEAERLCVPAFATPRWKRLYGTA